MDDGTGIELLRVLFSLGLPLLLLIATYLTGRSFEKRHFLDLQRRERETAGLPTVSFRHVPSAWQTTDCGLVRGSVVISLDYFKRFLASLRALVGGEVKSYSPLLDRARREALLRMKEEAIARGFDAVVNVRLETSRLASSRGNGKGTAGIEMVAYGTAVKRI